MDYFQGILEMHESGLPSAAPWFASARAAAPDAAFQPAHIGKALLHHKHWREAEEAFFACTTLDPGRCDGWAGLAAVYLKLRRNADAEFCAARAVACRFNHPFAHHQLGLARARQGHYAEAVASFETSQRLTPGRRHESRLLQILRIYAQMEAAPAQ
jgi:Flp pilus assembly protein TadD